LLPQLSKDLGLSKSELTLATGLADGAYAFGTVLAVQFAAHLRARRMLLLYVTAFLVAAVLAAWAPTGMVFVVALVVEGLCASLMLIAAAPPLVTGWPVARMPGTGFVMNLCVFGAVAAGPTIGGLQASAQEWRPLFWGVALIAAAALVFARWFAYFLFSSSERAESVSSSQESVNFWMPSSDTVTGQVVEPDGHPGF